ncbi:MAG: VWD domain-containing protein [Cyanobacteriota bacterium]
MPFDVDELDITTRLVFGTSNPGPDPNTHIRPDAVTSAPPPLSLVMSDYLQLGAGRYALPSGAPIIDAFFNDGLAINGQRVLANGTYTLAQLRTALNLGQNGAGSTQFSISQYTTDVNSSDFIERAYIFGSTGFNLNPNMLFIVNGFDYKIQNLEVVADSDNFDFQSSSLIASTANVLLKEALDPYGLIPEVNGVTVPVTINYTGPGRQYANYTVANYLADQQSDQANQSNLANAGAVFTAALAGLATNTGYLGGINGTDRFKYKTPDGKKIIYGTPNADSIDPLSAELTLDIYTDYQMVGGAGNDSITGSLVFGDELWGGDDNDQLTGRGGNDTLRGGAGQDVAVFRGDCLEYDIVRNGNGSITVKHARPTFFGANDGIDTLYDVEQARFSDGKVINLTLNPIHGCTELGFLRDFVTGTTQDRVVIFDMKREGDTSYPIEIFVDGRVTTGNAFFFDFFYTLPAGENPQLRITASVAEAFGDVAFDFEVSISVVSPLKQLVEFSDATAGGVLIGDRVDNRGGRWWGDPHLITFDNVAFDFQAEGEFVLAKATSGNPYELQARFKSLSSAVSIADAAATRIGNNVVSIEVNGNGGTLRVNGVVTQLNDGSQISVGNGSISRTGRIYSINHGNGDLTEISVFASFLNASPIPGQTRPLGSFEGLLGNNNGTPADDFRLANGTVLLTPIPVETLYGAYAQSWIVQPNDRLLPGAVTVFDAPDRIITVDSLPASLRAQAEAVVNTYGITNELVREAAILDYALTGNTDFIEAAVFTDNKFNPIVGTVAVDPVVNPVVILTSELLALVEENPLARKAQVTVSRGSTTGDLSINYALVGYGSAPATAPDFLNGVTSGSILIQDGSDSASFEVEIVDDNLAEEIEGFDVVISLEPSQANKYEVLVSSLRLSIDDADVVQAPTYTAKASANALNEGDRLAISLMTTGVAAGTALYWQIGGAGVSSSDFSDGVTSGVGSVGLDGRFSFSTVTAVDAISDPNEQLEIRFFSDANRSLQIGNTLLATVNELSVGSPTDGSDRIEGTENSGLPREIISGVPSSSTQRGKQSVDFLTGLGGQETFVLGDASGYFYNDGIASQKGSGDLGVILDFSAGDLIQLHGSAAGYKLSAGAYTGGGFTNMKGLYISALTPGSLEEVIGFVKGATLGTLSLANISQFIYAT